VELTDVVEAKPLNVAAGAPLPHAAEDAMIRTTFDEASAAPASCSAHASESVHAVACVKGPVYSKVPTWKL
jgi:hypothetical protein